MHLTGVLYRVLAFLIALAGGRIKMFEIFIPDFLGLEAMVKIFFGGLLWSAREKINTQAHTQQQ